MKDLANAVSNTPPQTETQSAAAAEHMSVITLHCIAYKICKTSL